MDGDKSDRTALLNGTVVPAIYADLTAPSRVSDLMDLSKATALPENLGARSQGASKKAKFEIEVDLERQWLRLPNLTGKSNSAVLKSGARDFELSRGPQHQSIIDFGVDMDDGATALFEQPFACVATHVRPKRPRNNREAYQTYWWRFAEPRPALSAALVPLNR